MQKKLVDKLLKKFLDNVSVYDVLEKGLKDLMELCNVVTDEFTSAIAIWKEQRMQS
jgi:hypothetical protein